jgi:hypothetical protein
MMRTSTIAESNIFDAAITGVAPGLNPAAPEPNSYSTTSAWFGPVRYARQLKGIIDLTISEMEKNELPDKVAVIEPETVKNPFA